MLFHSHDLFLSASSFFSVSTSGISTSPNNNNKKRSWLLDFGLLLLKRGRSDSYKNISKACSFWSRPRPVRATWERRWRLCHAKIWLHLISMLPKGPTPGFSQEALQTFPAASRPLLSCVSGTAWGVLLLTPSLSNLNSFLKDQHLPSV